MTLREELAKMWDDLADSEEAAALAENAKGTVTGFILGDMLQGCADRSRMCATRMRDGGR